MPISREESEKTSETRKSREISEEEILNFLKKKIEMKHLLILKYQLKSWML